MQPLPYHPLIVPRIRGKFLKLTLQIIVIVPQIAEQSQLAGFHWRKKVCDLLFDLSSTLISYGKVAKKGITLGNPDAVNAKGYLADINVQSIDDNNNPGNTDRTQDVKEFFHPAFSKEIKSKDGKVKMKLYHKCKLCSWVLGLASVYKIWLSECI